MKNNRKISVAITLSIGLMASLVHASDADRQLSVAQRAAQIAASLKRPSVEQPSLTDYVVVPMTNALHDNGDGTFTINDDSKSAVPPIAEQASLISLSGLKDWIKNLWWTPSLTK